MKYLVVAVIVIFNGCSNIEFNAAMCKELAAEPNSVIPKECKNYNEEEAQKAFDNTNKKNNTSKDDDIKFNRDENEKED
jgi:hypothetical protein